MDFGEVLTKAWQIIWKHKVLWIFGILASCSRGGGGGGGGGGRSNGGGFNNGPEAFNQFQRFLENIPAWVWILVAFVIVLLVLAALFLGTIGRIGLVKGTLQADDGAERLSLGRLFNDSLPYFWRVFLLNLVIAIASAILAIILIIPAVGLTVLTLGVGVLCLIPIICLMVPLFWLISIIVEQANVAVVAENLGVIEALQRGWNVFKTNLGPMVVMGLILMIGGLILGLIVSLPLIAIVLPVIVGLASQTQRVMNAGIAMTVVLFLLYLPIAIFLNGVVQSYIGAAWTLTFRRLTAPRAPSSPLPTPPPPPEPPAPPEQGDIVI